MSDINKDDFSQIIKFKIDAESADNISQICDDLKKTKSDIMRQLIPIVSCKEFEHMIPNVALEQLENYSKKSWEILHTPGCAFETKELSANMPAFITTLPPRVYVNYPTYKIQIINKENNEQTMSYKKFDKLLEGIKNISCVYATPFNYIIENNVGDSRQYPFVREVTCLAIDLADNIKAKDEVIKKLNENGFKTLVFPYYCMRWDSIEFLDENKKYFKIVS